MSTEQSPDPQNNPTTPAEDMPPPPPAAPSSMDSPPPTPEYNPPPAPQYSAPVPPAPSPAKDKRILAGILAIVLGAFGVHKFILGYQKEGIIMLVIGIIGWFTCFPYVAVAIIGVIEGIMYLTKTDEEFERIYIVGRKPWF